MRIGITLPQSGVIAGPDAVVAAATRAEELGYDSLWVSERLLWPITPSIPNPSMPGGILPERTQTQLDPLHTLTFAAAHTSRVALGTSVINLPFYQPYRLARTLATVDVLSGGRLRVGLGNGWMPEESGAVGLPTTGVGARADEYIEVLKTVWTDNPVEFDGHYVTIPRSIVGLKPVQKPYPPIYMAAFSERAMRRVARHADGWNPSRLPIDELAPRFAHIKTMADEAGRDADALELIVRANLALSAEPGSSERPAFTGSLDQVHDDIRQVRAIGAHEIILDFQDSPGVDSLDRFLELMNELWIRARAI